jgi:integrase
LEEIDVREIEEYVAHRISMGMKNSTVNREKATLSKMFTILRKSKKVRENPCREVHNLSTKDSERKVYISYSDALEIFDRLPSWCRPIVQTVYYSGMRLGEAFNLESHQIDIDSRIVNFRPSEVKENDWKMVPVHKDLVPVLEQVLSSMAPNGNRLFLIEDRRGLRVPSHESIKNPWRKAVDGMGLQPRPRITDFRHTWRRNARMSGIQDSIAEGIMGHWTAEKPVNRRYGALIDEGELVSAIDQMTYDHGRTRILVHERKCPRPIQGLVRVRVDPRMELQERRETWSMGSGVCDKSVTNVPERENQGNADQA